MDGVCSSVLSHVLGGNAGMLKAEMFSQIPAQFLIHGPPAEVSRHRSANVDHYFMLQLLIITGTALPKALMHLEARRNAVWQAVGLIQPTAYVSLKSMVLFRGLIALLTRGQRDKKQDG